MTQTEVRIPSECGVYDKLIQFHSVIQCNTYSYNATFLNDEMKNPRGHCRCGRQWVRGVGILLERGRYCQILCHAAVVRSVCRPDADRVLAEILSALPVLLPKKIRLLSSETESFRLHRKRKKRRKKPRDQNSRGFLCGKLHRFRYQRIFKKALMLSDPTNIYCGNLQSAIGTLHTEIPTHHRTFSLNCRGVSPVCFLKKRIKYNSSVNPRISAISRDNLSVVSSISFAFIILTRERYTFGDTP